MAQPGAGYRPPGAPQRRRYSDVAYLAYCQTKSVIARVDAAPDSSRSKRTLAQLRRGVGKTVAQTPFLWADIIRPDAGTREDWANDAQETATHIALTLWALHSQGPGSKANQDGIPFARALRALDAEVGGDTVRAHFASLLAARNDVVRERHLRSLVGLMHSRAIGFDYPDLAADLADLRSAFKADGVRRRWGRQYVGAITPPTSEPTTSQE